MAATILGALILIAIIPGGSRALSLITQGLGALLMLIAKRIVLGSVTRERARHGARARAYTRVEPDDGPHRRPGRDGDAARDASMDAVRDALAREHAEPATPGERMMLALKRSDEWRTLAIDNAAGRTAKAKARHALNQRFHPDKFPGDDAALQAGAHACQQAINAEWRRVRAGQPTTVRRRT